MSLTELPQNAPNVELSWSMTRRQETILAKLQEAESLYLDTPWFHFIKRFFLKTVIWALKYAINEIELYLEEMEIEEN